MDKRKLIIIIEIVLVLILGIIGIGKTVNSAVMDDCMGEFVCQSDNMTYIGYNIVEYNMYKTTHFQCLDKNNTIKDHYLRSGPRRRLETDSGCEYFPRSITLGDLWKDKGEE